MNRLIAYLLLMIMVYSCGTGKLGKQPPENVTIMASADGSVIVRQYSIYKVISYKQEGGKTERHGTSTNYLEVYDGVSGNLVSAKPYSIKGNCRLLKVTNTHAWLGIYNRELSGFQLLVLTVPEFEKAFDEKSLAEKNKGLIFKTNYTYYNPTGITGVIVQADDARIYAINETTGLATLVPDSIKTRMINRRFLQMSSIRMTDSYLSITGSQRKRITAKMNDRKKADEDIMSESDFINPYIIGYYSPDQDKELPLPVQDGLLVVSKTKDSNAFEFQFDLIDSATLKNKWSVILKNEKGETNENDLLDIQMNQHGILIISKNSMNLLDANTGKWKWNKSFE